ncbi:fructose-1,6-bisphosphatase [Jimgerdemannia flammicorona]|uniref:fructose-bisphosphatase n=1 Tax=Jimgerdemannia flammicorona TaxID=994334 RepID=A0A433BLY9_9FUNG|nr:fructose-1,6-bisphosphatase [Jimgerdemannia flammicorona]
MSSTYGDEIRGKRMVFETEVHTCVSFYLLFHTFSHIQLRLGLTGSSNVQGEDVKKLDVLANDIFKNALVASGKCCFLVSEEDERVMVIEDPSFRGKYIVTFDPLDGSSNIDCGVSIGTIFGIFKVHDDHAPGSKDIIRSGRDLVAAGYCMYGSYVELIVSVGTGLHGFTLDPAIGEFILTHPSVPMMSFYLLCIFFPKLAHSTKQIRIPSRGKIYSINEGNYKYFDEPTKKYVDSVKTKYSARYVGSMVADVHRTVLYGEMIVFYTTVDVKTFLEHGLGQAVDNFHESLMIFICIFGYPADSKVILSTTFVDIVPYLFPRSKNGKLRILYEVFPMAYLVEQAGGRASTGKQDALDITPRHIHDRSGVWLGSADDVADLEAFYRA